jgi:hypothetical protein
MQHCNNFKTTQGRAAAKVNLCRPFFLRTYLCPVMPARVFRGPLHVLHGLRQVAKARLRVAIKHGGAGLEEERILEAAEAASLPALEHDDALCAVDFQDGMPAMMDLGLSRASGLTTSFAPMTTATSVEGNSGLICSISYRDE